MLELLLVAGPLLWLLFLIAYLRMGIASVYHPATYYLAFHGFIFVLRPVLNWLFGYELVYRLYQFSPSPAEQATALAAAHLGFVAFMVAVLRSGNLPMRFAPPAAEGSPERRRAALVLASLVCLPLAVFSLVSDLGNRFAGAPTTMLRDAGTGIAYNTVGNGYFTDASNMLAPIAVLIAWQYRFRLWALLPFAAYAGSRFLAGNGRWTFIMAGASLAVLYLYQKRKLWLSWRVVAGGMLLLAVFVVAGQQRDFFRKLVTGQDVELASRPFAPLEGMDFANQEYLEYLVYAVPERTGTYGYFVSNLQLLTEPVPRVLWPDKPVGPPIQYYQLFDYGYPIGMTNSLPGEGWQQLGFLGVALWCGLFGWLFGRGYRRFVESRQGVLALAAYAMLLPLSIQFFRDGSLLTLFRFPLFFLVPIALWWLFARMAGASPVAVPQAPGAARRWGELSPAERRAILAAGGKR